jgi:hypothetical protein
MSTFVKYKYKSRSVPCDQDVTCPQVADGGHSFQIWTVASNIWNKGSRLVDMGWSSSFGVGRGANKFSW